jgi:NTE family protein
VSPDPDALAELVLSTDWMPFMNFESWTNGWRLLTRRGICATTALDTFLIQQTEGQSFNDLSVDLFVCATNLLRGERQVFSRAATPDLSIATAARASSSLPFVYPPKRIQNHYYVDGGLTDNIPGNVLPDHPQIPSVGIYLVGTPPRLHGNEPTLFALASLSVRDLVRGQEDLDRHTASWVRFVAVDT